MGIRESLNTEVQAALAKLPKEKTAAEVAFYAGKGWVEVRACVRVADEWRVGAVVRRERGDASVGVLVQWVNEN